MGQPAMELRSVGKSFGDNVVLDSVSLSLEAGNIRCVIGYNGSGKSTLAKIMCGEMAADTGEILLNGQARPDWNTVAAVAGGVVMIGEYASLFPGVTVCENLQHSLASGAYGPFSLLTQTRRILAALRAFTEKYGFAASPRDLVADMSSGDRVLLEFLRAQLLGVRVLIVDEIDVALGTRHKEIIKAILRDMREQGAAVLYISHKLDMILALADSVSLIQYSRITAIREKGSFAENDIIEMMFNNSLERAPKLHKRRGVQVFSIQRDDCPGGFALELYEGEILGVAGLGRGGSAGLDELLFGREGAAEISVSRRKIHHLRAENTLANGIVIMSAEFMRMSTFEGYSVTQNMLPFNVLKRIRRRAGRAELCQRYINILNIDATPSAKIETLSLGHQRKVFIARSILSKGDVFIFDNPTDSIDSVSKIDIYNIINELKTQGKGILLISSDLKEILGISDRIVTVRGMHVTGSFENNGVSREKLMEYL